MCDEDTKNKFMERHEVGNIIDLVWIKPGAFFKASRANAIITTNELYETEWFRKVMMPLMTHSGFCLIDDMKA